MKTNAAILTCACIIALSGLVSCANGPLTKQQFAANALADAAAAANGFLAGGQAGALLGLSTQEIANLNALAAKAKVTAAATSPIPDAAPNALLPTIPAPAAP